MARFKWHRAAREELVELRKGRAGKAFLGELRLTLEGVRDGWLQPYRYAPFDALNIHTERVHVLIYIHDEGLNYGLYLLAGNAKQLPEGALDVAWNRFHDPESRP